MQQFTPAPQLTRLAVDAKANDCDTYYFVAEMLTYSPAVLLFATGTIHFYKIRSIGFNRVVQFSCLFLLKLWACKFMILINLIAVPVLIWGHDAKHNTDKEALKCVNNAPWHIISGLLKVLNVLRWLGCDRLMLYEYRKGLSETWSALKLFWTMNMVFLIAHTVWGAYLE